MVAAACTILVLIVSFVVAYSVVSFVRMFVHTETLMEMRNEERSMMMRSHLEKVQMAW